ncbi:TatD family hydrolase [Phytohalomonas tamaricis]|uniref:TatD family hydrolase n=1 Tax=Phytohalomonas tamaricis TaxID=2081032 RepID=UPI000D0BE96F|nr:TatD family hydrolase [Phytohalomonas tamaricis]
MLIDAHCHLDFDVFEPDREAMFERAKKNGVEHFIVPATTRKRWPDVLTLGKRADVSVCLGLHPYFLDEHGDDDVDALEDTLKHNEHVIAIGECGVDARVEDDRQWALFDAQLKLAKRLDLPVVIHCVHLNDQVAKRLRQLDLPRRGVVHAYAGSWQQAERFLDLGYVLGVGGPVTHDRAQKLKGVIEKLPDDGFVFESDAPDMVPQGLEGRNEPGNMIQVIEEVARLRNTDYATLIANTQRNIERVFALDLS